jgi:hypothetical protein
VLLGHHAPSMLPRAVDLLQNAKRGACVRGEEIGTIDGAPVRYQSNRRR